MRPRKERRPSPHLHIAVSRWIILLQILQTEQELLLREYDRSRADEEAELCAVVDDYLSTRNDDVLCPVCTRDNLVKLAHNLIACNACGMRLDLECDVVSMKVTIDPPSPVVAWLMHSVDFCAVGSIEWLPMINYRFLNCNMLIKLNYLFFRRK